MSDQVKYVLDETRLPEAWYNLAADLPEPPPPVLHPGTGEPVGPPRSGRSRALRTQKGKVRTWQFLA